MPKFEPYPYQMDVAELILAGKNVILQAPTGSGKTIAALLPYLNARQQIDPHLFPRKCIYSIPMRVLANQFTEEYQKLMIRRGFNQDLAVTIQTGDRPEDPKLEGDLIFTTIDQTLSNFLCIPYALSNGQANINAGAIASSYLVFDEFHLFPPEALATTIAMLKLLNGVVPFLLMTATFSSSMLSELSEQLDAIVIPKQGQSAALQKLPSQQKERRFHSVDNLLTGQAVVGHHATQGRCRSIAICNTVDRAQALYAAVNDLKSPDTKVVLLHSRFYKEDRAEKETWLRREFGKDDKLHKEQSAILIATQVVEVGLDITCEVLHTEVAPANAILQRAGRCARYQSEQGDVYLYQVPLDVNGRPQYHPYHDKIQGALCESTWQAFIDRDGAVLSFIDEQTLISQVHGQADKETLQLLEERRNSHQDMMEMAMGFQDRGLASELIRSVDSRG